MKRKVIALGLVDLLLLLVLFLPMHRDYKRIVLGREKMRSEKIALERKLQELQKEKNSLLKEGKKLEEFRRTSLFLGDSGVVEVREIIRKAFSRAGVNFQGLTFSNPTEAVAGYYKIGISLPPVLTSYPKLRLLIYHLENTPKMLVIKSVTAKRKGGGKVAGSINLEAFFHEG